MRTPETKISSGPVVLVHGILTRAEWFQKLRKTLRDEGFDVHLTNYEWFDLWRFLLPIKFFRKKARDKLHQQIRSIGKIDNDSGISIIAHSFGTYLISEILRSGPEFKINRIIFCGSVVKYDFPFQALSDRFNQPILNEVAAADLWPALAESLTTGYGSAGTFGFKRPLVYDQWNKGGHSAVLTQEQCLKYWVPFLRDGNIVENETAEPRSPLYINIISIFKIKYIILAVMPCVLIYSWLWIAYGSSMMSVELAAREEGWTLGNVAVSHVITKMNKACPLPAYLPFLSCQSSFVEHATGRRWRYVRYYDKQLNSLIFKDDFLFEGTNPEAFWFELRDRYPRCILIDDNDKWINISKHPNCNLEIKLGAVQ